MITVVYELNQFHLAAVALPVSPGPTTKHFHGRISKRNLPPWPDDYVELPRCNQEEHSCFRDDASQDVSVL